MNPYFPGLGGGLDIFKGLNPNEEPTSPYIKQVSTNCRMVEVKEFGGKKIEHYKECSDIKMMAYNWIIEDMEPQGGACRWQGGVKATDESEERKGVCLCPATTKELCTKNRASCYFHTDRKTKEDTCISKPERFYNQLARLLAKRGKKDFSMKIQVLPFLVANHNFKVLSMVVPAHAATSPWDSKVLLLSAEAIR